MRRFENSGCHRRGRVQHSMLKHWQLMDSGRQGITVLSGVLTVEPARSQWTAPNARSQTALVNSAGYKPKQSDKRNVREICGKERAGVVLLSYSLILLSCISDSLQVSSKTEV